MRRFAKPAFFTAAFTLGVHTFAPVLAHETPAPHYHSSAIMPFAIGAAIIGLLALSFLRTRSPFRTQSKKETRK